MRQDQERDLEESLAFMRQQFQVLTDEIKLPESLGPELMRRRLELMEQERDSKEALSPNKVAQFPWKPVATLAACFVFAFAAYFAWGGVQGNQTLENKSISSSAAQEEAEAGAPQIAAAGEAAETAQDGGEAAELAEPAPAMLSGTPIPEADAAMPQEQGAETALDKEDAEPIMDAPMEMPAAAPAGGAARNAPIPVGTQLYSQQEALAVEKWGNYLPKEIPEGLRFLTGWETEDGLTVSYEYAEPYAALQIQIASFTEAQEAYVVDIAKQESYDLKSYDGPDVILADKVPEEYQFTMFQPIFQASDVTQECVNMRVFAPMYMGLAQPQGNMGVKYGEVVVWYQATNVTPEALYQIIAETRSQTL